MLPIHPPGRDELGASDVLAKGAPLALTSDRRQAFAAAQRPAAVER